MYLNSLNYFRGIAIVFIVAAHCMQLASFSYQSVLEKTIGNMLLGGTTFFVFISGFLFHHVFYKRFEYKKFFIKKLQYVLQPYLIISVIPIVYYVFIADANHPKMYFKPEGDDVVSLYLMPMLKYFVTGKHMIAYWYIPFIITVFAMSPVHMYFIKLRISVQITITIGLFLISFFLHRPIYQVVSVTQSVIYFTPVYLLGIICSEKKDWIFKNLKGKEFIFLFVAFLFAFLEAYSGKFGNYHKEPFIFGGIDYMVIQKVFFSLFFMIWLHRFEDKKIPLLDVFAANSFGIFFIHGILILGLLMIRFNYQITFPENSVLVYIGAIVLVFAVALGICVGLKAILKDRSKYIIGC